MCAHMPQCIPYFSLCGVCLKPVECDKIYDNTATAHPVAAQPNPA